MALAIVKANPSTGQSALSHEMAGSTDPLYNSIEISCRLGEGSQSLNVMRHSYLCRDLLC